MNPDVVADLAYLYRTGNLFTETRTDHSKEVSRKMDQLIQINKEKPVLLDRYYDQTEKALVDVMRKGNKIERNHKKLRLS